MKPVFLCCSLILACWSAPAQTPDDKTIQPDSSRMAWFKDAKLGIFIHWGIYAVNGIDESWSFHNGYLPYDRYMEQLNGFTANHYKPDQWAALFRDAGARYAVLTSKHHDGVALWDTRLSDLSVVRKTPAGRDLIRPLMDALRQQGIKAGLYFSLLDWSCPDYPEFIRDQKKYDKSKDPARWQRFLDLCHGQLRELTEQFKPDLYWFDGDWEHSAQEWDAARLRDMLLKSNPHTILNSRLAGYGDYATPEQGVPVAKPKNKYWELCLTMNDSWGYQGTDTNYKTPYEIIRIFADVVSQGGNLLLDIGPKADGTIAPEQENILRTLGQWNHKHAEAIFGSRAGLPYGHFYGPTTLSKDRKTLYLFLTGESRQHQVILKGIKNKINLIRVLGSAQKLPFRIKGKPWWSGIPGIVTIDTPAGMAWDDYLTVLAVELDGPIQIHREDGMVIEE